jgi:hypothetical protein
MSRDAVWPVGWKARFWTRPGAKPKLASDVEAHLIAGIQRPVGRAGALALAAVREPANRFNAAGYELPVLQQQCLNYRLPNMQTVQAEVTAWVHARNTAVACMGWRSTTDDARIKLKRLYPVVNVPSNSALSCFANGHPPEAPVPLIRRV